jgi:hypothetical protein
LACSRSGKRKMVLGWRRCREVFICCGLHTRIRIKARNYGSDKYAGWQMEQRLPRAISLGQRFAGLAVMPEATPLYQQYPFSEGTSFGVGSGARKEISPIRRTRKPVELKFLRLCLGSGPIPIMTRTPERVLGMRAVGGFV